MNDDLSVLERRSTMATAAIALLLGLFAMNALPVGVFQDDGHYLILARALAQGDGFRYMNLPGAPAAAHFPPGYPLLLAPIWWLAPSFPANVVYFKLVNVLLLPVVAMAIRVAARQIGGLSSHAATAVALASVATVPVLFLNGLLFSETAFMAAFFGLLPAVEHALAAEARPSTRRLLLLGVAMGAIALLRTVGVTVLPAALVVLGLRRRWREALLVLAGALIVLAPWQLWASIHARAVPDAIAGGYGAYGPWLGDAWRAGGLAFVRDVIAVNLRGLLIPLTLFGLGDRPWPAQALAAIALLTLAGVGARRLWTRAPVMLFLLIPYGALLLVWPFPPDRFLWPLWPILLIALAVGAVHMGGSHHAPRLRLAGRLIASVMALLFVVWHARTWPSRNWEAGEQANGHMGLATAAVAAALPRDGLVASDQDAMVHLYAGRPAVPLLALTAVQHVRERTDAEVGAQMEGVLEAYHPRWVLVAERESLRAARHLVQRGRLKLVGADTSGVLVYDVVR